MLHKMQQYFDAPKNFTPGAIVPLLPHYSGAVIVLRPYRCFFKLQLPLLLKETFILASSNKRSVLIALSYYYLLLF